MSRRPALKVFLLFAVGLVMGRYYSPEPNLLFAISVAAICGAVLFWKSDRSFIDVLLATALVAAAFLRYEIATGHFPQAHISNFTHYSDKVVVTGVVTSYPDFREKKTGVVVAARQLIHRDDTLSVQGKLQLNLRFRGRRLMFGDEVRVEGWLRRPRDRRNPGEFDYRDYLMAQNVFATMSVNRSQQLRVVSTGNGGWFWSALVVPVKRYLDAFISSSLPERESALLHGLLIGERGSISPQLKSKFADAGVIHILAVSGLHVGFVLLIFLGVFGMFRFPYGFRVCLAIGALAFFACLTNLKPPVVRASIMGGLLLTGTLLERKSDVYNTLALAALCILVLNPLELFQPGFQLSFAAVVAIIYLYPKLRQHALRLAATERLLKHTIPRHLFDLFVVSAAALFGTLPFTILYFHRIPVYTMFSNIVVIPLAFCGLATALAGAVASLFSTFVAETYMASAGFFLSGLIKVVEWTAALPFSNFEIFRFSVIHLLVYTAAIVLIVNFQQERVRRWFVIFLCVVANLMVWHAALTPRGILRVTFLDVGQGDACLITLPDDRHLLIDGGPKSLSFDAGERIIYPYLVRQGIEEIHALILTHAHADHLGGLPYLLRHVNVHEVWDTGLTYESQLFTDFIHVIDSLAVRRRTFSGYEQLHDFSPVEMYVLHPTSRFLDTNRGNINEVSLVLKMSYGSTDFLFVGDVERLGERRLIPFASFLNSEVLKVAHHGSRTSSTVPFLQYVRPEFAIISVGEFNKFRHPSAGVVARLQELGATVFRTDRHGAVLLQSDGHEITEVRWK